MAAKILISAFLIFLATEAQAGGYATFASTYNAHTINHAVAYPAGSKVGVPPVAATPSLVASSIPTAAASPISAAAVVPAIAPTTAASLPPAKPANSETPVGSPTTGTSGALAPGRVPFNAFGQVAFAGAHFGFASPPKVGFATSPVSFAAGAAYPSGPIYATGSGFVPSHSTASFTAAPAYTAPVYGAAPSYPAYASSPSIYSPGTVAFASGSPVPFGSGPANAFAASPLPGKFPFSAPSYVPW